MEPLVVYKQEPQRSTINFALTAENKTLLELKKIGRQIENELRSIPGISQINISGYPDEEIEIAVDRNKLLAFGLSFNDVAQAVAKSNIIITGGKVKTEAEEFLIRANNKFYYGDQLSNIEVLSKLDGTKILLRDVADIKDRFSETPNRSFLSNDELIKISVSSTNSEDVISSSAKVRDYIKRFNNQNKNSRLEVLSDASDTLNGRNRLLIEKYFSRDDSCFNFSFTFFKFKVSFLGGVWPTCFIFRDVYFCSFNRSYNKCIIYFRNDYSYWNLS